MTLEEALVGFVRRLETHGIPYMVIGGFANLQWGEARTTLDLDITADAPDGALVEAAREAGSILVDDPTAFLARARVLPIRLSDGTRVDLIAATLSFEIDAIARAKAVGIGGSTIRFCRPEDLVLHKIVSERPRDFEDVRGILRRQGSALDHAWLDATIEALANDLAKPEILERYRSAKREAG